MTRTVHDNTPALHAYIDAQIKAHRLLAQIQETIDTHQNALMPEDIHWGHVGDMQRIIALLDNVVAE